MDRERKRAARRAYEHRQRAELSNMLGLDRQAFLTLASYLDDAVARGGCDHTPRNSTNWAVSVGRDPERLNEGLAAIGIACDCEVLLNLSSTDFV